MKTWSAFFTLCLVYGSSFMFVDIAVDQLSPLEITFIRLLIGASCLTILLLLRGQHTEIDWWTIRSVTIIGIGNSVVPSLLIAWAQQQDVGSGLSGVLLATNPLFSMVIAHLVFTDDRMNPTKVFGVALGFAGVIILASRNWQGGSLDVHGLTAQGAIIAAAVSFAFMGSFSRHVMQHQVPPLLVAAGAMSVAATATGLLLALDVLRGNRLFDPATLESDTTLAILELSFIHSFFAYPISFFVIRELGVTKSSMVTYVIPVVSLIMGAVFLNEIIDTRVLIGTAVILGGVGSVNLGAHFFRQTMLPAAALVNEPGEL